jgi:ankyrin repeat protein
VKGVQASKEKTMTTTTSAIDLILDPQVWFPSDKSEQWADFKLATADGLRSLLELGHTHLDLAVLLHNPAAVDRLLSLGHLPQPMAVGGHTPLHTAASSSQVEIAKRLIDAGADVNQIDSSKNTPLHCCTGFELKLFRPIKKHSSESMVRLLVERGADIEAVDRLGRTPLHKAIISKNTEMVMVLLNAGADVQAKFNNVTAQGLALRGKQNDIAQQIKGFTQAKAAGVAVEKALQRVMARSVL